MANQNNQNEDIQYVDKLFKHIGDLQAQLQATDEAAKEKQIADEAQKYKTVREHVIKQLQQIEADGIQLTEEQKLKYAQQSQEELWKQKLADELSVLDVVTGKQLTEQKKLHAENVANQKKVDAIKARNALAAAKEELKKNPNSEAAKKQVKTAREEARKAEKAENKAVGNSAFQDKMQNQFSELLKYKDKDQAKQEAANVLAEDAAKSMKAVGKAITEGLNAINTSIKSYGETQYKINTRLQGATVVGSSQALTFANLIDSLAGIAYSPLINTETLYKNLETLVEEGVASNLEQRSILMTLSEGIAATFDADSDSLRRMIRLQQADSTAARLGMEYYLSAWLNEYVANTEYLTSTFDSVADSLLEASALLKANTGVTGSSEEFEYTVQKWLGALVGVGFSESTAQSIASALGKLGTGDVDFFSEDIGKLITISASNAGLDIGALITEGIDATDTNKILKSLTEYLQDIADESSNVVKSQLAKTFGVTVTDLIAVTNLEDLNAVYDNVLAYTDMYSALEESLSGLAEREGISKLMNNALSNYTYQTGMDIASSPIMYATWAITDLIGSVTGGINIPAISALGTGIDLETTVDNLIKLGLVGVSTIGNIGNIVNGLKSIGNETSILDTYAIYAGNETIATRGNGLDSSTGVRVSSTTSSSSSYVGNENGEDMAESAVTAAEDSQASKKANAKASEQEEDDRVTKYLKNISFGDGFKTIVSKVKSIASSNDDILKKLNGTINVNADIGSIQGWFNAETGKWGV